MHYKKQHSISHFHFFILKKRYIKNYLISNVFTFRSIVEPSLACRQVYFHPNIQYGWSTASNHHNKRDESDNFVSNELFRLFPEIYNRSQLHNHDMVDNIALIGWHCRWSEVLVDHGDHGDLYTYQILRSSQVAPIKS